MKNLFRLLSFGRSYWIVIIISFTLITPSELTSPIKIGFELNLCQP